MRNTDLNSNTWARNNSAFTNFTPPEHYNQFGFNVGGPFFIPGKFNTNKNKIFWYYGEEWLRRHYTDYATLEVPTALMRNGNFSELLDPNNFFYKGGKTIKDPKTGLAYTNNVIPTATLSPNGLGLLRAYPVANLASPVNGNQNWYATGLHTKHQRKDTLSADFNLTDNQRISFHRSNFAYLEYQPLDGGSDRTPKIFNRPNQTNSINYVWTIRNNLVMEALGTVTLDDVYIPVDTAHFYDRTQAGINYPYIYPVGKTIATRIPTVNIASFGTLNGGPYPSHSSGPIYNASDSLTWIKGVHTFKFGLLFERSGENDGDEINVSACSTCTNNQNGQFNFTDTRSGNPSSGVAAANVALGLFDSYSEIGQRAYTPFRGTMWEFFAQDSWKVTSKLHIDYGVRDSIIVPYHALWGNMIVFDPSLYDPSKAVTISRTTGLITGTTGDPYNGMVIPGSGFPDSAKGRFPTVDSAGRDISYLFRGGITTNHYSDIHFTNIQPRAGIAYNITPKTVIRAGGGRFITRLGVSDSVFLGGNPPFQPTANVTFGNVDNPGGTSANAIPLTVTTQSRAFNNPEAWNWNATIERELPWKSLLSVGYVGRRGLHLQRGGRHQPTDG